MTSSARSIRWAHLARAFLPLLVVLLVLLPTGATASTRQIVDEDDTGGRLDVVAITQGHAPDGRLRHTLRAQRAWPSSLLADGTVTFVFQVGLRFRSLDVRERDGRLVGRICTDRSGTGLGLVRCSRDVEVTRPDSRSMRVTLDADLVKRGMTAYRWQVVTLLDSGEGGCRSVVCAEQVPDDGEWVKHRL